MNLSQQQTFQHLLISHHIQINDAFIITNALFSSSPNTSNNNTLASIKDFETFQAKYKHVIIGKITQRVTWNVIQLWQEQQQQQELKPPATNNDFSAKKSRFPDIYYVAESFKSIHDVTSATKACNGIADFLDEIDKTQGIAYNERTKTHNKEKLWREVKHLHEPMCNLSKLGVTVNNFVAVGELWALNDVDVATSWSRASSWLFYCQSEDDSNKNDNDIHKRKLGTMFMKLLQVYKENVHAMTQISHAMKELCQRSRHPAAFDYPQTRILIFEIWDKHQANSAAMQAIFPLANLCYGKSGSISEWHKIELEIYKRMIRTLQQHILNEKTIECVCMEFDDRFLFEGPSYSQGVLAETDGYSSVLVQALNIYAANENLSRCICRIIFKAVWMDERESLTLCQLSFINANVILALCDVLRRKPQNNLKVDFLQMMCKTFHALLYGVYDDELLRGHTLKLMVDAGLCELLGGLISCEGLHAARLCKIMVDVSSNYRNTLIGRLERAGVDAVMKEFKEKYYKRHNEYQNANKDWWWFW
jgi:hypothetical protein